MESKYHSKPAPDVPFFLPVLFVFLILLGTYGSVYGQWNEHMIDSNFDLSSYKQVFDIENDGDIDLFIGEFGTGKLLLYENNSNESWTRHTIDDGLTKIVGLDIADFDNDGGIDIVTSSEEKDLIVIYLNGGGDPIQWIKHTVDKSLDEPATLKVEDINGDSLPDVVAFWAISGILVWYENNLPGSWIRHQIGSEMGPRGGFSINDVNADDKPDVVKADAEQNKVILFRNNLPDTIWTQIIVDDDLPTTYNCNITDINNDGILDIAASSGGARGKQPDVVWYENDGYGMEWTKHPIPINLTMVRWSEVADIDANSYVDVILTDAGEDEIVILLNQDGGTTWTKFVLEKKYDNAYALDLGDIDNDSDIDIIPDREIAGSLVWYENPLGTAHAITLLTSPYLIQAPSDTLKVSARLSNPDKHQANAWAVITGDQSGFIDTLKLFDDGMHGDEDSSDHVWGNIRLKTDLPEDEFLVDLFTYDSSYMDTLGFAAPARFITLGPLELAKHSFVTSILRDNTIPYPGALLQIEIKLKNNSATAVAKNISAELSSSNPFVTFNSLYNYSTFPNISAGETVTSSRDFWINISNECPVDTNLAIVVNISSYEQVCWQDTFHIFVEEDHTRVEDFKSHHLRIYPNPATKMLTIESASPTKQSIEIISLNGQLIYRAKMDGTSHQVDLSSFHEGVYLVKIRSNDFIATRKLIKLD